MIASEDMLCGLNSLLENGRDLRQLLGRYVLVTSKRSRVTPLEVEREYMVRSKSALGQCNLVGYKDLGFGEFSSVDEGR